jgi:CRISPR-associated protein Csn2
MKLQISGFEKGINITNEKVSVLEIENKIFFSRLCQSLLSGMGSKALEPYAIWDEEGSEVSSGRAFEIILNPFDLPWTNKEFTGKVLARVGSLIIEEDAIRQKVESLGCELQSVLKSLNLLMYSNYDFAIEWDVSKHLKSFGFSVDINPDDQLLDNFIKFFEMLVDAGFNKVLVFVNLKAFLSKNELEELYEQIFLSGIRVLLIESFCDEIKFMREEKSIIDQHLLQV